LLLVEEEDEGLNMIVIWNELVQFGHSHRSEEKSAEKLCRHCCRLLEELPSPFRLTEMYDSVKKFEK
jgi:hypothetical protein